MDTKHRCRRCNKIAVWVYIPGSDAYPYYCEDHVPRGCSCVEEDDVDEHGRPLPCVEYQYGSGGWVAEEGEEVPPLEERLKL